MIATKSKTVSGVQVEVVEEPLIQKKGKKIGILGGTFNPPHIAHLLIAEQVGSQLGLDKVLFIPDFIPPHISIWHNNSKLYCSTIRTNINVIV